MAAAYPFQQDETVEPCRMTKASFSDNRYDVTQSVAFGMIQSPQSCCWERWTRRHKTTPSMLRPIRSVIIDCSVRYSRRPNTNVDRKIAAHSGPHHGFQLHLLYKRMYKRKPLPPLYHDCHQQFPTPACNEFPTTTLKSSKSISQLLSVRQNNGSSNIPWSSSSLYQHYAF